MSGQTFEQAVARLEDIVRQMERGDLPLEDALKLFEEGAKLSRVCARKLAAAEQIVVKLARNADGELTEELFEEGRDGLSDQT